MNNAEINQQAEKLMNVANIQEANFYIHDINSGTDKEGKKSGESNIGDDALFADYIRRAIGYFSMKKTLLYEHQPHSFYELYVCNNLAYYSSQISGFRGGRPKKLINDATPNSLEEVSKYTLIAGTGGIGKSMFLRIYFCHQHKNMLKHKSCRFWQR